MSLPKKIQDCHNRKTPALPTRQKNRIFYFRESFSWENKGTTLQMLSSFFLYSFAWCKLLMLHVSALHRRVNICQVISDMNVFLSATRKQSGDVVSPQVLQQRTPERLKFSILNTHHQAYQRGFNRIHMASDTFSIF